MIPDHTRRMAERLLARYCGTLCVPPLRSRVELGFRVDGGTLTVFEKRRLCGVDGSTRAVDVARFRYAPGAGSWRLECPRGYAEEGNARWRAHRPRGGTRSFARLLLELEEDPRGRFFPRINGASLRFCTSQGRCPDCAARSRAMLGVRPAATARAAPRTPPPPVAAPPAPA